MADIEFTSWYYLCMSWVKPETHLYTQLYTFPLKRSINNKTSLFINVHFDLEQENVHSCHQSLLKPPFNFKSAIINNPAEWILALLPPLRRHEGDLVYINKVPELLVTTGKLEIAVSCVRKNDTFRHSNATKSTAIV